MTISSDRARFLSRRAENEKRRAHVRPVPTPDSIWDALAGSDDSPRFRDDDLGSAA